MSAEFITYDNCHEITLPGFKLMRDRFPFQSPEQIQPVDQNNRLILRPTSDRANGKRTQLVGEIVSPSNNRYMQTAGMAARHEGL